MASPKVFYAQRSHENFHQFLCLHCLSFKKKSNLKKQYISLLSELDRSIWKRPKLQFENHQPLLNLLPTRTTTFTLSPISSLPRYSSWKPTAHQSKLDQLTNSLQFCRFLSPFPSTTTKGDWPYLSLNLRSHRFTPLLKCSISTPPILPFWNECPVHIAAASQRWGWVLLKQTRWTTRKKINEQEHTPFQLTAARSENLISLHLISVEFADCSSRYVQYAPTSYISTSCYWRGHALHQLRGEPWTFPSQLRTSSGHGGWWCDAKVAMQPLQH